MVHQRSLHWLTSMRQLVRNNLTWNRNRFSNGPRKKELFITLSCVSQDQEESQKSNKLSWTWTISSQKAPWLPKETVISTLPISWREKVMDPVSHQEVWDKLATPEPTLSGISSQTSSSETETKPFTSPHSWSLTTAMHWMTRLYSELVRESSARALKASLRSWVMKTAELWWLWDLNNNFSPFQEKLISRESISDQPVEHW